MSQYLQQGEWGISAEDILLEPYSQSGLQAAHFTHEVLLEARICRAKVTVVTSSQSLPSIAQAFLSVYSANAGFDLFFTAATSIPSTEEEGEELTTASADEPLSPAKSTTSPLKNNERRDPTIEEATQLARSHGGSLFSSFSLKHWVAEG